MQALRGPLWQTVKLPRTLREAGLTDKALLPGIRDLAINDGALLYNRKDADGEQLLALLERAWGSRPLARQDIGVKTPVER